MPGRLRAEIVLELPLVFEPHKEIYRPGDASTWSEYVSDNYPEEELYNAKPQQYACAIDNYVKRTGDPDLVKSLYPLSQSQKIMRSFKKRIMS
jgi:hypothetical protein